MNAGAHAAAWVRRAQPLLGTLVEVGVRHKAGLAADEVDGAVDTEVDAAIDAAFAAVRAAQACLSRFEADSDLARFAALPRGGHLVMRPITQQVLTAARLLQDLSAGAFDISLGSAPQGWALDGERLHKLSNDARLDLGGIGKGHAVDLAVQALIERGVTAGWVNAGGDLRAFGDVDAPIRLRDESGGGVRAFASLRDGAFATSDFGPRSRARLAPARAAHVSVAAPRCLWADALTKVVAVTGDTSHPLLDRLHARAWLH